MAHVFGAFPGELSVVDPSPPKDRIQIQLRLCDAVVVKDNNNNAQQRDFSRQRCVRRPDPRHDRRMCIHVIGETAAKGFLN